MAVKKRKPSPPTSLTLRLDEPGMTPILRAGLGGLAASLSRLPDGALPGTFEVASDAVTLDWGEPGQAGPYLERLFRESFRLTPEHGLIDLPGTYRASQRAALAGALQDALKLTLLQHGKYTKKEGPPAPYTFEDGDQQYTAQLQRYKGYVQRDAWEVIAKELDKPDGRARPIKLASWAGPGAVQRHVAYGKTNMEYSPAQAVCACFALVGTLSYRRPRGGAFVIPVPADLRRFAKVRPRLTPQRVAEVSIGGAGDAALSVQLALKMAAMEGRAAVAETFAYDMRSTAWASQQKSRVDVLRVARFSEEVLDRYQALTRALGARLIAYPAKGKRPAGYFADPSALRGFVADNLARGCPWYRGFSGARDPADPSRFLHTRRQKDNKGALRPHERGGLTVMIEHLDEAERLLVRSVHSALRNRLGAIASENQGNPHARKSRWERERERLRLAFAGAKTHAQVRHALADLWSRAGVVPELQQGWEQLLPLLRADRWQDARDLSLIALASYAGRAADNSTTTNKGES